MRLYIQAVREVGQVKILQLFYFHFTIIYCPHQILVRTRMLEEGEEGLGSEENQPPIIIDAEVNIVQSSLIAWLVSTKSFNISRTLNWL